MIHFTQALAFKILFPVILVTILFSFVISYSVNDSASKMILKKIEAHADERTQKIKTELKAKIETWTDLIQALSWNEQLALMNWERSKAYLSQIASNNNEIQSIFIADRQGNVNNTENKKGNIAERDYFKKAMDGKINVSEPIRGKLSGRPLIIIASPLYLRENVQGVIGIAVELEKISSIVNREIFGKTGYSFMIDGTGIILAHPNKSLLFTQGDFYHNKKATSLQRLVKKMIEQKTGVDYYYYFSEKILAAFTPLGINNWSIASSINFSEITEGVNRLRNSVILITLSLFFILTLLIIFLINFTILQPVKNFQKGVDIVRGGNLAYRIDVKTMDEIGQLKKAFNELTDQTVEHIRSLVQKESILKESLHEREVLLNEVHHRVKNNLSSIIGLLSLQKVRTKNKDLQDHLNLSINRIYSMSLVHEQLYQSGNFSKLNFKLYIEKLIRHLNQIYNESGRIAIHFESIDIELDLNKAMALSLIINELVTNSFKHGFEGRSSGSIHINLQHNEPDFLMLYRDDGKGVPDDWSPSGNKNLGYELIESLVKQLEGTITHENNDGLTINISVRNK